MEINPNYLVDNQNRIELRGTTAFNSEAASTSSSRGQMQASAISQHYVIKGNEPNPIQTGAEQEYGKGTYSIQAEHNISKVIAVIPRYIKSPANNIKINPQTIVIYETYDESPDGKPMYGIIDIPRYSCKHTGFGFPYKRTDAADQLRVGEAFTKDTVFYDTPAKDHLGNYNMGVSLNTVYASCPGTIEDLIMINKEALAKLTGHRYTTHTFEAGEKEFLLNIYGENGTYKVMPDIGEFVNPKTGYEGMLMAKRPYFMSLLPITFTRKSTAIFDPMIDVALDGKGPNGRVVDIIVYRNSRNLSPLKDEMTEQLHKYENAYVDFCHRILTEYTNIKRLVGMNPHVTDEFSDLLKRCMAITNRPPFNHTGKSPHVQKVGNFNRRLDDYHIQIVVEHIVTPVEGYKITDLHG